MSSFPKPEASGKTSPADAVYQWADERLGLTDVVALATHKQVPQHKHSFWYYWGGISLLCFIVQLLTGVLLLV